MDLGRQCIVYPYEELHKIVNKIVKLLDIKVKKSNFRQLVHYGIEESELYTKRCCISDYCFKRESHCYGINPSSEQITVTNRLDKSKTYFGYKGEAKLFYPNILYFGDWVKIPMHWEWEGEWESVSSHKRNTTAEIPYDFLKIIEEVIKR
ncbi:MAG: hypothetical protein ABIB79_03070 [archaeon]